LPRRRLCHCRWWRGESVKQLWNFRQYSHGDRELSCSGALKEVSRMGVRFVRVALRFAPFGKSVSKADEYTCRSAFIVEMG